MHFTESPLIQPGAWDLLIAAGQAHPGTFRLAEDAAARLYKWDVRDAPAAQGAVMTYRGWRPTLDIQGTFQFWEEPQIEAFFRDYMPIWTLDARKFQVKPIEVYHPSLAANEITKLVPVQIGNLSGNSRDGWSIKFKWHEYRPAKIILPKTPEGATTRLGKPTPQTETQRQIQEQLALVRRPL
jgi:hypothetical protein